MKKSQPFLHIYRLFSFQDESVGRLIVTLLYLPLISRIDDLDCEHLHPIIVCHQEQR